MARELVIEAKAATFEADLGDAVVEVHPLRRLQGRAGHGRGAAVGRIECVLRQQVLHVGEDHSWCCCSVQPKREQLRKSRVLRLLFD
jgi:hypothetical protein